MDLLTLSPTRTHAADTLVYPKDKQNVSSAVDCLMSFSSVVKSDLIHGITFRLICISKELQILADVFSGIIEFFVHPDTTIKSQIRSFSKAAYLLFYLFRNGGMTILPTQLYHDIQATLIDAIYCCIKM